MTETRTYRYPSRTPHYLVNGEARYSANTTTRIYECKLHHPDAAEMATIHAELAAGLTKKEVARRHRLGEGYQRLSRLLKKFPQSVEAAPNPPAEDWSIVGPSNTTPVSEAEDRPVVTLPTISLTDDEILALFYPEGVPNETVNSVKKEAADT